MPTKKCICCKETKDIEEFYNRGGKRNGKPRTGKNSECKLCARERTKRNATPESKRFHMVKFRYNLSKEEYSELLKKHPVCACCGNEFQKDEPTVDHCHKTGKVRALLCHPCNAGLGRFKDNRELLLKAVKYLEIYDDCLAADCP